MRYKVVENTEFYSEQTTLAVQASAITATWDVSGVAEVSFDSKAYGYSDSQQRVITITNSGNQPTGDLDVTLVDPCEHNPVTIVSATEISSLIPGGIASITLQAEAELDAGNHYVTLRITNTANNISKDISVSFIVEKATITSIDAVAYLAVGKAGEVPSDLDEVDEVIAKLNAERGTVTVNYLGGTATAPVAWAYTGTDYTPNNMPYRNQIGAYTFEGMVALIPDDSLNINATTMKAAVDVIVNDVPHSISLGVTGTDMFDSRQFRYAEPPAAHTIAVTNQGTQATGALVAELSGGDAFELIPASGEIASVAVNGTGTTVAVRPKTGLEPGTYTATLTVSGTDIKEKSYELSFTVANDEIAGFAPIAPIPVGAAGYAAMEQTALAQKLLAEYGTVTAITKNSREDVTVTAWTSATYNKDAAGDYTFTATLNALPAHTDNLSGLTATITVTVETPVDALAPEFSTQPRSFDGFVGGARPLNASAYAADSGTVTYQWYSNTANDYAGGTAIIGETAPSYTPPADEPGIVYYWCVAVSENAGATGATSAETKSAIVDVTLRYAELTVEGGTASVGTRSGESGKYAVGESATVTADNAPSGQTFDKWEQLTGPEAELPSASRGAVAMPEGDAAIKATYKAVTYYPATPSGGGSASGGESGEPETTPEDDGTGAGTASPGGDAWENPFTDVHEDDWFYGDVEYAVTHGIFNGTGATTFEPGAQMTRAMLVTALWRQTAGDADVPPANAAAFDDVDYASWYGEAVSWAVERGIVNGIGDNKFAPDKPVTRQEFVTILYRRAVSAGTGPTGNWATRVPFADVADIADWAMEAVIWATQNGITTGKPGGLFDPRGDATRAEAAAMVRRELTINN